MTQRSFVSLSCVLVCLLGAGPAGAAPAPVPSFPAFQKRVEAATLAMMNGDPQPWEGIYSHAPDATLFGGWGGHEKGWDQLAARWKMVAGRFRSGTLEIERVAEHVHGDIAVTVQIVTGEASFSDGSSGRMGLRVTHVCRVEGGEWRVFHRHADEQLQLLPIRSHLLSSHLPPAETPNTP